MKLSPQGIAFLQASEGLSLMAYPDGKNADGSQKYSIGYGHSGAKKGQVITRAEADALFLSDVAQHEAAVTAAVSYASQRQFDALVSFSYNVGTAGMQNSTAVRLHNAGNAQGAADALRMWNQSDGQVNPVLVRRREKERSLYLYGDPNVGTGKGPLLAPPSDHALLWAAAVAAVTYFALPKVPAGRRLLAFG